MATRKRRRGKGIDAPASAGWLGRIGLAWWMPALALLAPLGFGVFRAFVGDDGAATEFGRALWWPGAAIYAVTLVIVWAGWTLELE